MTSKIKISLMSKSLFTWSKHSRVIKEVQRVAFVSLSSFWKPLLNHQDMPSVCSLLIFLPYLPYSSICPDIIRGFLSHTLSLLHLGHARSIFFSPTSTTVYLSRTLPWVSFQEICWIVDCPLRFKVWAYKPCLEGGWFWTSLSGIWCEQIHSHSLATENNPG